MSHFVVMVIGPDVDKQLAPYQENNMGDCPRKYLDFFDQEEEMRSKYETGKGYSDDIPFKEKYSTYEVFVREYYGYEGPDPETSRYGYWENPNAKWDWYQIGGRWQGLLKIKEECLTHPSVLQGEKSWMNKKEAYKVGYADQAPVMAIDWDGMKEDYIQRGIGRVSKAKQEIAKAKDEVQIRIAIAKNLGFHIKPEEAEKVLKMSNEELRKYYSCQYSFSTYAIVKDGQWISQGDMGWWGMSDDKMTDEEWAKKSHEAIMGLPEDTLITIVDCHI